MAAQATEFASGNDITSDEHGKSPGPSTLQTGRSGHDITSGTHSQPDRTPLLTSHPRQSGHDDLGRTSLLTSPPREYGRDIPGKTDRKPAQIKTESGRRGPPPVAALAMFGFLFIGVLTAISHHLFYSYLNKQIIDNAAIGQTWAIRIGTAFGFLFKTVLVAAMSVVYAQGFWFTVRRNAFEIGTLDDFFTLLNNPLRFYNKSLYGKASLLFALAMVAWLIPISAVFAPGALTVTSARTVSVVDTNVPVLAPMDNFFGIGDENPPTHVLISLAARVASEFRVIPWSSPCGINCSYTFSFIGPAHRCVELGPFSSASINLTEIAIDSSVIYNTFGDVPPALDDRLLYYAIPDTGNETRPAGIVILYDSLNQTLRCDLYNATYTTVVSYMNNQQTIQNDIELHNSILDGTQLTSMEVNELPNVLNDLTFWGTLNFLELYGPAVSQLIGYIYVGGDESTPVAYWQGLGEWNPGFFHPTPQSLIKFANLATNFDDFLANYTLSLIGANMDPSQLVDVTSTLIVNTSVPATLTSYPIVYTYDAPNLWESYAPALGIAAVCVIVGSFILHGNGVAQSLMFGDVLVTTRNPRLDKVSEGAGLGGKYITDRVRKLKVKYELLEPETNKMGFGTKD